MAAPTTDRRTVRAQVRYARVSPSKVREVLGLIRGRSVREAEEALALTQRDPADIVAKCLSSAVANAEHNDQIEGDELFVAECYCDQGPVLKRWRPRARGRATRIQKKTSHITVVLGRYTAEELQELEDQAAARGAGGGRRDAAEERRRRVARSRGEDVEDAEPTDDAEPTEVEEGAEAPEADETTDADETTEAGAPAADVPGVTDLVDENTKDELLALAAEHGVEVAKSANKTAIAEAIVAARDGADEGEG